MVDLINVEPYRKDQDFLKYCEDLANLLFAGMTRRSGLPVTQSHLEKVVDGVGDIIIHPEYKISAKGAGWLHDVDEEIEGIRVYNPFQARVMNKINGKIYLNDLLAESNLPGVQACSLIDWLTHRTYDLENMDSYFEYYKNIFSFKASEGMVRNLRIVAGAMKIIDTHGNTNPDETENAQKTLEEYRALKDATEQELIKFYRKIKVIDTFRRAGQPGVTRKNEKLLMKTLEHNFRHSQMARAGNNLAEYIPIAERQLLVKVGKDNGIFDWYKLRELMKQLAINSLRLYAPGNPNEGIYTVERLGLNRKSPAYPNYRRIYSEIREDIISGRLDIPPPDLTLFKEIHHLGFLRKYYAPFMKYLPK
jgi:hypothetical protein